MLNDALRAFREIFSPALRRVLWQSLILSVLVLALFGVAAQWGLNHLPSTGTKWLDEAVEWLSRALAIVVLIPLVHPVVSLVAGFFLERAAAQVEATNYPSDPPGRDLSFFRSIGVALRFTILVVVLNLLALPFYLIPLFNIALFWSLNGYLLSREYFELVAFRHLDEKAATQLRRSRRFRIFLTGILIAMFATIPFLNLLAPLFSTALMVHTYKRIAPHASV
jgi:CysZ protein